MRPIHRTTVTALAFLLYAETSRLVAVERGNLTDEQTLAAAKVGNTGPDLLAFFGKRTLRPSDVARIAPLVKKLGAAGYRQRQKAKSELIKLGPPALPELRRLIKEFDGLKRMLSDTELESRKNAAECVEVLAKNPGPGLPLAALRLLEARKPDGTCKVLLGYLPFSDNKEVEEEVMEALLMHGRPHGKVDQDLVAALQDKLPLRRAAAGYALGRMGDISLRPQVRALLADSEPFVRQWAGYGLTGKEVHRAAEQAAEADRKLFETHKLPTDDVGLLSFFQKRTLSDADQKRLKHMVGELGSKVFRKRDRASRALTAAGSPALPFLREGLTHPDVEIASRARRCITRIETGPGKALAAAGTRQIMRRAPAQALEALLGYVPFADDDDVEQEVLQALSVLACREVKVSPALARNLKDAKPARRSAAAFVLGRVGTSADCAQVRPLLGDSQPRVRFEAAQALLASRDKAAIPVLVELLADGPFDIALAAEDMLGSATGAQPTKTELSADRVVRKKSRDAWNAWWQANAGNLDLAASAQDTPTSRAHLARKVSVQMLDSLIHFNIAGFKKSLKFPFYMEGMTQDGTNVIKNAAQLDQFFKMLDMIPQIKQEMKQMAFKVTRVGRLDEYLADAPPPEKGFLSKLRKPDIYIVYMTMTRNGREEMGGGGALFVRMSGGRAWVVGFGNPRARGVRRN